MDRFHLARQAGELEQAIFFLNKALHTPEYRAEALIWKGIDAMQQQQPHEAFLYLSAAAAGLPNRSDIQALIGRAVSNLGQPGLATRLLTAAWKLNPTDSVLRSMLWQLRSQTERPENLRRSLLSRLPEITDAQELQLVVGLLNKQPGAPLLLGVSRYDAERREVSGWALNLRSPGSRVQVYLESGATQYVCTAEHADPLLTQAGLASNQGAFRVQINDPAPTLHIRYEDGTPLIGSPLSNLPTFVPPPPVGKQAGRQEPVDILVPVYDGLEETLECLNSVIGSRALNRTAHRLVVLDDATPNPALRRALADLAAKGDIVHIEQATNLGFIRNVNRGMALHPERDVVWLNADTRVHGNWLDRLRAVAYSAKDIASVTPFTNNGELMSFPVSRVSHTMPTAEQQAVLDELALTIDSPPVEIETGCGFCLYIKRQAIDEVGYLDEVELLRGYGEETDWCLRARSLGWRHMGAPSVFVAHQGGVSFGEEKVLRVAHNNAILKRRYPTASARYQHFCLRDPLQPSREALQRARLHWLATEMAASPRNAKPLQDFKQLQVHCGAPFQAPLSLHWKQEGARTVVTLHAELKPFALNIEYRLPGDAERMSDDLKTLNLKEIVYRQLSGCPADVLDLATKLEKPYRIVCRDNELLRSAPSRDWNAFVSQATSLYVPWKALRKPYAEAFPGAAIVIDRHTLKPARPDKRPPRVLMIADELTNADLARLWIELGRRITRDHLKLTLLAPGDSPWLKTLLATGAVHALPQVQGLEPADCASLAGCTGALSLEANPGAGWKAPAMAALLRVSLYAVPGAISQEAGALSMKLLPFSLSPV
ncbi:Glycosyltransferase, GT2 family [Pseudomonas sp. NFACC02]|uniref:glycosyltransferase family 2 protein n=1 Tax=Pseudomonas sp. NFACC02 TaxID=1566250 RepID=UPI0008D8CC48|nr:glycosyltransferase family 2 protein [Pseudomonas sp. NFACC02]SER59905.1 Glycosyltransferase, GT2 family [Pseudomonas sp. NFACC02]